MLEYAKHVGISIITVCNQLKIYSVMLGSQFDLNMITIYDLIK